jgi:hypothetical protein
MCYYKPGYKHRLDSTTTYLLVQSHYLFEFNLSVKGLLL